MFDYVLRLHKGVYLSGNDTCDPTGEGWKPMVWVRNIEKAVRFYDEEEANLFLKQNPTLVATPEPCPVH